MSEVGRRNRRRQRAGPSLGEYYSASANSDAFTKPNNFAVADIHIFTGAEQSAGCVRFRDVRVSASEFDAAQVNTAEPRLKRVLLMQLHAAFTGSNRNEVSGEALVVLADHCLGSGIHHRPHLSRDLGARLRQPEALGNSRLPRACPSRHAPSLARRLSNSKYRDQENERQSSGPVFLRAAGRSFRAMARTHF